MKLSLALLSATIGATCAFAPHASISRQASPLRMSTEETEEMTEPVSAEGEVTTEDFANALPSTVGTVWTPDESKPCFGLPGAIAPFGYFDPVGFCKDRDLGGVKRFREAEVLHGRVAMMATVGYLIGENTPTIAYGFSHPTIANNQIPEVPGTWLFSFFLTINICEAYRAAKGWVEPGLGPLFTLRDNYYPGDLGFDPLGLKPTDPDAFANMQAKELSNGRLAMIAAAGMCVQEQVTGKPLLDGLF